MDPLTHTATGLFLSRAGLNRLTPQAAPILMLAANAPDIDIVTTAGGSLNYLHYHRHLTHSLAAMPVGPEKDKLLAIPTGLTVARPDVDLLVEAGRSAIITSEPLRLFLRDYGTGGSALTAQR